MSDHHHGHAAGGQLLHDIQHLAHHFRVQCGGRLVEQHDLRLHHHGADDGNPLLLSAGKLNGVSIRPVSQTHTRQQGARLLFGLGLVHVLDLDGSNDHILQNGLVGEQIEVLEHHAHLLPVHIDVHLYPFSLGIDGVFLGDVHAVKENMTAGGHFQQVQTAQQGAFAGAGGADDHHHISLVDVHADIVQCLDGTMVIVFFQVLHLNQLISGRHGSFSFQNRQ